MFEQKKTDAVVEFLRQQLDPVFIYFADHTYTENIFDVAYYSEVVTDEYTTCLLENKLSEMLGCGGRAQQSARVRHAVCG